MMLVHVHRRLQKQIFQNTTKESTQYCRQYIIPTRLHSFENLHFKQLNSKNIKQLKWRRWSRRQQRDNNDFTVCTHDVVKGAR
jgi:hypothetical protein